MSIPMSRKLPERWAATGSGAAMPLRLAVLVLTCREANTGRLSPCPCYFERAAFGRKNPGMRTLRLPDFHQFFAAREQCQSCWQVLRQHLLEGGLGSVPAGQPDDLRWTAFA